MKKIMALLVFIVFAVFLCPHKYHHRMTVLMEEGEPLIEIQCNGQDMWSLLSLGSYSSVEMDSQQIAEMKLPKTGTVQFQDGFGVSFAVEEYQLDSLKIGGLKFKNVALRAYSSGLKGGLFFHPDVTRKFRFPKIGRNVLQNLNCLIDLSSSVIYMSNNEEMLRDAGYDTKSWTKTKIVKTKHGFILELETAAGRKKMCLDTATPKSHFRKASLPANSRDSFSSYLRLIEGESLGNFDFVVSNLSDKLQMDGILGCDFLSRFPVYFDFENQSLYVDSQL